MKLREIQNLNQLLERLAYESMDNKVSLHFSEKVSIEFARYADGDKFKHEKLMRAVICNITNLEPLDIFFGCSFSGGGIIPLIQKYHLQF